MIEATRERQVEREAAARQLALGQRARIIEAGHLGPVLKRWINADVVPIARLMRDVAGAYVEGDMGHVATLLDAPSAELSARERPLAPLMAWMLRGRSPGRADTQETTHAEDLALSFLATIITRVCQDRCTVSAALALAADSLRDTVQGQFITSVQGAAAMQAFRERNAERWKQRKSLNRICARLHSQVRPELARLQREATVSEAGGGGESALGAPGRTGVRGKKVLYVLANGQERRIHIRPPDALDWEVMSLCWRDEKDGATQAHRSLWLAFAGMFLAAAQRQSGWFEIAGETTKRRHHTRTTKYLVLSPTASDFIKRDIEKWVSIGFAPQPMIVPPESGDYLTVKHRPVTGQRPPLGLITDPSTSSAWLDGAAALSTTPWTVNAYVFDILEDHPELWDPEDLNSITRVAEHRRLAGEEAFYLPTCMDFRGRIYYRTPWVSPQSSDLGKALLCWPPGRTTRNTGEAPYGSAALALRMHLGNLYGNGLDKAPWGDRSEWLRDFMGGPPGSEDYSKAEKPTQLAAAVALLRDDEWDRIPVSLDGTCNGLQHLTALLRDETAAPHVNLTASSLEDRPADIYGTVAERAGDVFETLLEPWSWRLMRAGLNINRKLTKGPVMVLPYGGTLDAIIQSVKASVLAQLPSGYTLRSEEDGTFASPWHAVDADGLGAMTKRDLKDHPLFNSDCRDLARLIWDSIHPVIPRAMQFMKALQEIGSWLGPRALAWRVPLLGSSPMTPSGGGVGASAPGTPSTGTHLWVIQAKSKASKKQVTMRGFHMPDMVRRLTLMANTNEIDPRSNRTGIVANFIHSLDAAHLAGAIAAFRASGGGCVGAVHDNVWVRPSEAALMGDCLRETFARMYTDEDPLWQPVKTTLDGETWEEYGSWYSLAQAAGVDLPARGTYDVNEVRKSAWFFS